MGDNHVASLCAFDLLHFGDCNVLYAAKTRIVRASSCGPGNLYLAFKLYISGIFFFIVSIIRRILKVR